MWLFSYRNELRVGHAPAINLTSLHLAATMGGGRRRGAAVPLAKSAGSILGGGCPTGLSQEVPCFDVLAMCCGDATAL